MERQRAIEDSGRVRGDEVPAVPEQQRLALSRLSRHEPREERPHLCGETRHLLTKGRVKKGDKQTWDHRHPHRLANAANLEPTSTLQTCSSA